MTVSRAQTLEEEVTRLRTRVAELELQGGRSSTQSIPEDRDGIFQAFFEHLPHFAWVKDQAGKYIYANRKMQVFFQQRGLSWYGKTDSDFWPLQTALRIRTADLKAESLESPHVSTELLPDQDGELVWEVRRFRVRSPSGEIYLAGTGVDATPGKQDGGTLQAPSRSSALALLEALRQSGTSLDQMFHSELTGIVECSGTTIVDANDALLGWLGISRGDLLKAEMDWRQLTSPRFRALDDECLEQLQKTGVCRAYEKELICVDGRILPVIASASVLDFGQGSFIGFFLNTSDRQEMGNRLLRSQKLESMGVIAGGVAHDFNNLLATIMGNASLALGASTPEHATYRPLSEVLVASRRASDLTRQLLAYSGRAEFIVRSIDLSSLVKEIGSLLETTISKKLDLTFQLAKDLPYLEGDEGQILQVVMNLVINASDAIGENPGEIRVSTYATHTREEQYVCFEVQDTGCGMDAATKKRIFDPFFTTKMKGRGLGLAAVMNIMRNHHGNLVVESVLGQGTTFRAYFPVSKIPQQTRSEDRFRELAGSETVLVVDDDAGIRRMTKTSLERFGYTVLLAKDGADAVEEYLQHKDAISLVLLDWAMPVMNGEEALERIHEINPEAKVLLSSGYAETETVKRVGSGSLAGFLQKPYTMTRLAEQIREILSSPDSQRL